MKIIAEYFKLYCFDYHFEEGPSEKLIDKESFIEAMKEYVEEAIKADRENLLNHVQIIDEGGIDDNGYGCESWIIDKNSLINAPNIELL